MCGCVSACMRACPHRGRQAGRQTGVNGHTEICAYTHTHTNVWDPYKDSSIEQLHSAGWAVSANNWNLGLRPAALEWELSLHITWVGVEPSMANGGAHNLLAPGPSQARGAERPGSHRLAPRPRRPRPPGQKFPGPEWELASDAGSKPLPSARSLLPLTSPAL